jgi:catechol 2,3-dioxygenase-like lactoylglutathione lyase family enzyme
VDILSSRILLRPGDLDRSRRFYRDVLGLAIYREFGPADDPGVVFFLGPGLLEVSGHTAGPAGQSVMIWIQVRDVRAEHARLAAAGVPIIRGPATEPWGLTEMWIHDPDGIQIVLVEFPPITLSAVTRDRRHHQADELYAADGDVGVTPGRCINQPVA